MTERQLIEKLANTLLALIIVHYGPDFEPGEHFSAIRDVRDYFGRWGDDEEPY